MRTAAVICLTWFLGVGSAYAQSMQEPVGSRREADEGDRRISSRFLRPDVVIERLTPTTGAARVAWRHSSPLATRKFSSRRSAPLIGLAAGAAAAILYWTYSGCQSGSDSGSAMFSHCIAPSGGMVVGGWLVGRAIAGGS